MAYESNQIFPEPEPVPVPSMLTVNCVKFSSYSVTVFQLRLLGIFHLPLQLRLTEAYFSVVTGFQLQLQLTGITPVGVP